MRAATARVGGRSMVIKRSDAGEFALLTPVERAADQRAENAVSTSEQQGLAVFDPFTGQKTDRRAAELEQSTARVLEPDRLAQTANAQAPHHQRQPSTGPPPPKARSPPQSPPHSPDPDQAGHRGRAILGLWLGSLGGVDRQGPAAHTVNACKGQQCASHSAARPAG